MTYSDNNFGSLQMIVGTHSVFSLQDDFYHYLSGIGAARSEKTHYMVTPTTIEEVQEILKFANKQLLYVVSMENIEALADRKANRSCIIIDLKRMNRIIEVNEESRFVLIEAGVTDEKLNSYFNENHPKLQYNKANSYFSGSNVVGTALSTKYGCLSTKYGNIGEMINSLEVILPSGKVCYVGSCGISPAWFSRGPLPDLAGLFICWQGITGIPTKMSIRIYPKPTIEGSIIYKITDPNLIPRVLDEITFTEMAEQIIISSRNTNTIENMITIVVHVASGTVEGFELKKNIFENLFKELNIDINIGEVELKANPNDDVCMIHGFSKNMKNSKRDKDFECVESIFSLDKVPEAWKRGMNIARKYDFPIDYSLKVMDQGHQILFTYKYPFNKSDESAVRKSRKACDETEMMTIEIGGLPYDPSYLKRKNMIRKMDPVTLKLMSKIKKLLDPNDIMGLGAWEIQ